MRLNRVSLIGCLLIGSLSAQVTTGDEDLRGGIGTNVASEQANTPFFINLNTDQYGKADFKESALSNQHMKVAYTYAEIGAVYYYNPCYQEGLTFSLGYQKFNMDWDENPYFHQDVFEDGVVTLGGFTNRFCGWLWQGFISYQGDLDHSNPNLYSTYDLLLWGRYDYSDCLGVHLGFFAETGMKLDRVYPIIGFDYRFNDRWKLNMIYPLNMSIEYDVNCFWKCYAGLQFFDIRQRTGKDETLERAILRYQSTGAQIGASYNYLPWISIDLHAGYTLGARLKIADQHNDHPVHYKLKSAPYIGGEINIKF